MAEVPVVPGESNTSVITGENTENQVLAEGKVTYDIRFHAWRPDGKRKIK